MVIIDVHACGVEASENMYLAFYLNDSNDGYAEDTFAVQDDLTIRIPFNDLNMLLGLNFSDFAGATLRIEASDSGEFWEGPVPASGNIEAELV